MKTLNTFDSTFSKEKINTQCAGKTFVEMKWEYNSVQISYWRSPTTQINKINNVNEEWEYYAAMSNRFKKTRTRYKNKAYIIVGIINEYFTCFI